MSSILKTGLTIGMARALVRYVPTPTPASDQPRFYSSQMVDISSAATIIYFLTGLPCSMVEYEDGSGYKFNYRLLGQPESHFVDFKAEGLIG